MAKSLKALINALKERLSRRKTEGEKINEEYEKERKVARNLKVNRNAGSQSQTHNEQRDISAI